MVWGLAALGIGLESVIPRQREKISVPLHLTMGWLMLIAIGPLLDALHPTGVQLLFLGGIAYTLGVGFYAWDRLPFNHAIWHLFVIAGSVCHFSCVIGYVIPSS